MYKTLTVKDLKDFISNTILPDDAELNFSIMKNREEVEDIDVVGLTEINKTPLGKSVLIFDSKDTIQESIESVEFGGVDSVYCFNVNEVPKTENKRKTSYKGHVLWFNNGIGSLEEKETGERYLFNQKEVMTVDKQLFEDDYVNFYLVDKIVKNITLIL